MQTTDPNVYIDDADWGPTPVGKRVRRNVTITNNSDAEAIIDDYTLAQSLPALSSTSRRFAGRLS
jgi:hypothetical protein